MLLLLVLRILLFCSMIRFITSISHTNILSGYIYISIVLLILFNSSSLNDASGVVDNRRMLKQEYYSIEIARAQTLAWLGWDVKNWRMKKWPSPFLNPSSFREIIMLCTYNLVYFINALLIIYILCNTII